MLRALPFTGAFHIEYDPARHNPPVISKGFTHLPLKHAIFLHWLAVINICII